MFKQYHDGHHQVEERLPAMSTPRPYFNYSFAELKEEYASSRQEIATLRLLFHEVSYRQKRKPRNDKEQLLKQIKAQIRRLEERARARDHDHGPSEAVLRELNGRLVEALRTIEIKERAYELLHRKHDELRQKSLAQEEEIRNLRAQLGTKSEEDENDHMDITKAFKVLEIHLTEDLATIKAAYRNRIKEYHPDRVPSELGRKLKDFATRQAQLINRAWNLLREEYAD